MAGVEIMMQGPFTVAWDGKKFGARRWKVWGGATQATITRNPTTVLLDNGTPLPAHRSDWNGMWLDSYTATPIGADVFDVVAQYSNLAQGYKLASTYQTESIAVPYCIRSAILLPDYLASGQHGANQFAWELRSQQFLSTMSRLIYTHYRTFPDGNYDIDAVRTLQSYVNELHRPWDTSGQANAAGNTSGWYRFEGGTVMVIGKSAPMAGVNGDTVEGDLNMYEMSFSWVSESGIKYPTGGLPGNNDDLSDTIKFPDNGEVRFGAAGQETSDPDLLLPPFHRFVPYRPAASTPAQPWEFTTVLANKVNPSGWQAVLDLGGPI